MTKEEKTKLEENLKVEEMYTTLSEAKKEIWRRWNDKDLRKKVEEYLGEIPEPFRGEPRGAIFRYIATPNLECDFAVDMSNLVGLDFVFIEFLMDKFCALNKDKFHLAQLKFFENNKNKHRILMKRNIINFDKSEGVSLRDVDSTLDKKLYEFHHEIFLKKYPKAALFDASFFKSNGESPEDVYFKTFCLFILNGILFENYFINTNPREREFTLKVVYPTFNKIKDIFGVKPLIVPLVSSKEEGNLFWQFYSEDIKIQN